MCVYSCMCMLMCVHVYCSSMWWVWVGQAGAPEGQAKCSGGHGVRIIRWRRKCDRKITRSGIKQVLRSDRERERQAMRCR
jgi:hypothetical protein